MTRLAIIFAFVGLTQCASDETLAGYGGADRVWTLTELDGVPFPAQANLTFPETGKIAGQAPCNRYFAEMKAPYPWFETGPIAATRMACPDLQAETDFLTALGEMTESEITGKVMILRDDAGREMVFTTSD